MSWPEHGAMPDALMKQLNQIRQDQPMDFSVNTNPLGPPDELYYNLPKWVLLSTQYSEPSLQTIKQAISEALNVKPDQVLPGNGGAELIYAAARLFQQKKVILIEPTFTEYRKALEANQAFIVPIYVSESSEWKWSFEHIKIYLENADGVWICNPNNPTGKAADHSELMKLLEYCKMKQKTLVVDEAFYDFQQEPFPFLTYTKNEYPVVQLRSLTKMFTIPGLRAGYMVASENVTHQLNQFFPPWNVNIVAEKAMSSVLHQKQFVEHTVSFISQERDRIKKELDHHTSFYIFTADVNFFLLCHRDFRDTKKLLVFLAENNIHARHTYHFPMLEGKYIRLAVRTKPENDYLINTLLRWNDEC
ncbi:aminotransferase class I/II-fold pyridoxal phosphate-dependent enzyme [Salibacterium salarium]|uniref:Aminotransferase class I/II-fold pyridoxal phosphate-dependent enzyme n=1 Tax=Salibacterium salarium TaxID=284579 RepID=A0A428N8D5_9BACI|nr:aminotransferase class I/II-fold pyridoxal phosphate-dependent enzyme [Salibacterium salarium]RSL34643.1 aminotransferase class I/II-fold pyridoxal phosphate-dependent enzyme [Salibacterium salarium]